MFRELTQEEQELAGKMVRRGRHLPDDFKVQFYKQGNFTVCLLLDGTGNSVHIGVSKRNCYCDKADEVIGWKIAMSRAMSNKPILDIA